MLDDAQKDWQRHTSGLEAFAETYVSSGLQRGTGEGQSQRLIRKLELVADKEIASMYAQIEAMPEPERTRWMPDCKAGCAHCCHQIVGVTIPELLYFVDYILENCTPEQVEEFKRASANYRKAYESRLPGHSPMYPCPILVDDRCAAYEGRCLICRGYNSLDVNQCIERKEHPERQVEVRGLREMAGVTLNLRTGVRRGLESAGLSPEIVILGIGLDIAFKNPDAANQYYQGLNPFEDAKLPEEFARVSL